MSQDALDLLLSGVKDQAQRKQITTAYYAFANGDPGTFAVQFAVLLRAHATSLKLLPPRLEKALATETNSIRDAIFAHRAFIEKTASVNVRSGGNDRGGEKLEAIMREIEEHLAAYSETLKAEREAVLTGIADTNRRLLELGAHRIVIGLILGFVAGILSVLVFQRLLPFLL